MCRSRKSKEGRAAAGTYSWENRTKKTIKDRINDADESADPSAVADWP